MKIHVAFDLEALMNEALLDHGTTDGKRGCRRLFFNADKFLAMHGHVCRRCHARQQLKKLNKTIKLLLR